MKFRFVYLQLVKLYKILDTDPSISYTVICYFYDMYYVLTMYHNFDNKELNNKYKHWRKLYIYRIWYF